MQRVTLPGTDVTTSVLGFGTAQLMARLGRRQSVRLLRAAFDAGITHIDTARLYGYGEAESAVGDLLDGRRQQVTVATKFGIFPPKRSPLLQTAKMLARALTRLNPRMRERVRARAGNLVTSGRFNVPDAQRSLETSLKELRTDYVDLLLLHECRAADLENADELETFLDRVVAQGMVRAYGIATDIDTVDEASRRFQSFARVALFPSDARNDNVARVRAHTAATLTHSPFGKLLHPIETHLDGNGQQAKRWSDALGVDCRRPDVLTELLLGAAHAANPAGVVVFASTDESRIRANAAASERAVAVGQEPRLALFKQLVAEVPML